MYNIKTKNEIEGVIVPLTNQWDNYVIVIRKTALGLKAKFLTYDDLYETDENGEYDDEAADFKENKSVEIVGGEMASLFIWTMLQPGGSVERVFVVTDTEQACKPANERSFMIYLEKQEEKSCF